MSELSSISESMLVAMPSGGQQGARHCNGRDDVVVTERDFPLPHIRSRSQTSLVPCKQFMLKPAKYTENQCSLEISELEIESHFSGKEPKSQDEVKYLLEMTVNGKEPHWEVSEELAGAGVQWDFRLFSKWHASYGEGIIIPKKGVAVTLYCRVDRDGNTLDRR